MEKTIIKLLAEIKEDNNIIDICNSETKIIDDIGLDSLQMVNFFLRIEEELGIEIDFDTFDFSNLYSVKTLTEYIAKNV